MEIKTTEVCSIFEVEREVVVQRDSPDSEFDLSVSMQVKLDGSVDPSEIENIQAYYERTDKVVYTHDGSSESVESITFDVPLPSNGKTGNSITVEAKITGESESVSVWIPNKFSANTFAKILNGDSYEDVKNYIKSHYSESINNRGATEKLHSNSDILFGYEEYLEINSCLVSIGNYEQIQWERTLSKRLIEEDGKYRVEDVDEFESKMEMYNECDLPDVSKSEVIHNCIRRSWMARDWSLDAEFEWCPNNIDHLFNVISPSELVEFADAEVLLLCYLTLDLTEQDETERKSLLRSAFDEEVLFSYSHQNKGNYKEFSMKPQREGSETENYDLEDAANFLYYCAEVAENDNMNTEAVGFYSGSARLCKECGAEKRMYIARINARIINGYRYKAVKCESSFNCYSSAVKLYSENVDVIGSPREGRAYYSLRQASKAAYRILLNTGEIESTIERFEQLEESIPEQMYGEIGYLDNIRTFEIRKSVAESLEHVSEDNPSKAKETFPDIDELKHRRYIGRVLSAESLMAILLWITAIERKESGDETLAKHSIENSHQILNSAGEESQRVREILPSV